MRIVTILVLCLLLAGCQTAELRSVREKPINEVDLLALEDGEYTGSFSYGNFTYTVRTTVKGHQIKDVEILSNRETVYAKKAEGVIPRIIAGQTPDVDGITGATTTSKALMKAVENSLTKQPQE